MKQNIVEVIDVKKKIEKRGDYIYS